MARSCGFDVMELRIMEISLSSSETLISIES